MLPERRDSEVRRLLDIAIRDPISVTILSPSELDLTLRVSRRAGVLGRLAYRLDIAGEMDSLPGTAVDQLRGRLVMAESRSRIALWELNRIAWALAEEIEKPLVLMKGCTYLLMSLPNASGRVFADVDIMTSEDSLETVEAILQASGWKSQELTPYDQNYYRKWTHELPPLVHREREMEIDLHHNILPRTARLKPQGNKLLARSQTVPGTRYRVLADEDIVLHAMTHLMFDSDLADRLGDLVDVADLLAHFTAIDEDFWDALVNRAVELDLKRPTYYGLRYCRTFLGLDVPERVQATTNSWGPIAPVRSLMDILVARAIFPQHPDMPSRLTEVCRFMLYIRSHWVRMPPWLLAYHLSVKFLRARMTRR